MSYRAIDWAMNVDGLTSSEKSVLICLAWHMNEQTGNCSPSIPAICSRMAMGHNTVRSCIKSLESKGLVTRRVGGNSQSFELCISASTLPKQVSPNGDPQIGNPTQMGMATLPKQGGSPYPNREENKEVTGKEQGIAIGDVTKKTIKRHPLTFKFGDAGIESIPDPWKSYCAERRPDLNPDFVFADFKAYFTCGKGADEMRGQKGWNSSWQGWVRRQSEQRQSTTKSSSSEEIARRYLERKSRGESGWTL